MIDLSLCVIAKNEEKYIGNCIDSVVGLANEILVLDNGSSDNTAEIVKEKNGNVFTYPKTNGFSALRNQLLRLALGKWILHLDADEELHPDSRKEIEQIIQTNSKQGFKCRISNKIGTEEFAFKSIRLFYNTSNIYYLNRVHEQIYPSLIKNDYSIKDSNIEIIHHGYNTDEEILREKAVRNLGLLLEQWEIKQSWITAKQLGDTYRALNEFTYAEKYYKYALVRDLPEDIRKEINMSLLKIAGKKVLGKLTNIKAKSPAL